MHAPNPAYHNFIFSQTHTPIDFARLGTLHTPHGILTTPNFIFCGTKASVKGLPAQQVADAGAEIILANTYHLMINPGAEHILERGGLHKFMNWKGPLLTDSGGYQVFAMGHGSVSAEIKKGQGRSLPKSLLSISEEGVVFKSYYDGSKISLTPEKATSIQQKLGADLFMQFDECTPFHVDKTYTASSMQRSLRWGNRCLEEFTRTQEYSAEQSQRAPIHCEAAAPPYPNPQAMYGIIQGGTYEDLRKESAQRVQEQKFWGNAIGGSLGANKAQMYDIIAMTARLLDVQRPLHLLGIGDIPDVFWGVRQGIDTFDCVHPTRIARHACAIVPAAISPMLKLNLKNSQYATDDAPLDASCTQACCTAHSRAYIHYLFKAKELLGMYLLTLHNVAQMSRLMKEIQASLQQCIETQSSAPFDALQKFWAGSC